MIKTLKEIYAYRDMISMLVRRELRGRYKASMLGFFWTFLNPLLQLGVYTLVFSTVMRMNVDKYYLFLFVALIPWLFMATSVQSGSSCIISQKDMVSKIFFPRQVLPIACVTTCFVNMLLCFIVVFIVLGLTIGLNFAVLPYLIPVMLIEYILALGLAFLVSAVTVFFRDMEHILGIFVMVWQFLTPVIYPVEYVPERIMPLFSLNPMTSVIIAYQDILYFKSAPDLKTMLLALGMGVVFLAVGWIVFSKLQRRFAEEL
jgi:ABC-2 type transport system permease protein